MFTGPKAPKTCPGCEARASEIERLSAQVDRLLDQVLTLAGKPEAIIEAVPAAIDDADGKPDDPPPDPYHEAAAHLSDHAAARGMRAVDFADA